MAAWPFAAFCLLQFMDMATTLTILDRGGYERNPLMAKAMAKLGPLPALALVKGASIALLAYFPTPHILLFALDAFYIAVVVNNIFVLRQR